MNFSKREPRAVNYASASTTAVAVLSQLRQQASPLAFDIPQFAHSSRSAVLTRDWLGEFPRAAARQALLAAAFAALVLALATTLPVWAFFQGNSSPAASYELRSSAGVTGAGAARVHDVSATAFVGQVPFVQQLRYFDSLAPAAPRAAAFVQGARESTLVSYLQNVGTQMTLPYLSDAVANKQAIESWTAAVQESKRQAALQAARTSAVLAWQSPPVAGGTALPSTVTFYACLGNGFCGHMANGESPFAGAAACSANLPMGTRFIIKDDPAQQVFTCLDRGALAPTWVDIWFYDSADGWSWQSIVGTSSEITIVP